MIKLVPSTVGAFLFALLILSAKETFSQNAQPDPHYKLITGQAYVQSKNYYLLTLFNELPEVRQLLAADPDLKAILKTKTDSLSNALKQGKRDPFTYTTHLKFSDAVIELVAERLKALFQPGNALGQLVKDHLIPSGTYILLQNLPPAELLAKAWEQDARGINFAIGVYAEGSKANYPNIDSISFPRYNPKNGNYADDYIALLYSTADLITRENAPSNATTSAAAAKPAPLFFQPSLTAALTFVELNGRDQAADYEPMTAGENKAAFDRIRSIRWEAYKYSLIVIPGAGPEDPGEALSAESMLRCRFAAIQYRLGLAPFIMPSGGKVHPYKTPYCEALEMKKYLVEQLHIPANAVLIEPHARHTTTNMRNAARLIWRYGIPFNKPGLTCTTKWQSNYIEKAVIDRCLKELHEAPYKNGNRLSETELEFYPLMEALHINPSEPIDP